MLALGAASDLPPLAWTRRLRAPQFSPKQTPPTSKPGSWPTPMLTSPKPPHFPVLCFSKPPAHWYKYPPVLRQTPACPVRMAIPMFHSVFSRTKRERQRAARDDADNKDNHPPQQLHAPRSCGREAPWLHVPPSRQGQGCRSTPL